MMLDDLVSIVLDKSKFNTLNDYITFAEHYLAFVATGLQAVIVAQNETNYRLFQYKQDGNFNITRPLNADLLLTADDQTILKRDFLETLDHVREIPTDDQASRNTLIRTIYTLQQCIGATLDALPSGRSNQARKVNGDRFERLIQLLISYVGVNCVGGIVQVPVYVDGEIQFTMSYQHDLLIHDANDQLRVIGSVKTSSKDRIDKIFIDKFLYSKLTDTALPHIAIFLNDVQRKPTRQENQYGVSPTFLPGHFKGYSIKLNPLDGVYYCDIRPNMQAAPY